ncbi:MAG: hypothetical protein JST62_03030 [Bacteroidetes bacterium]|nr:hypothetical protein [Bacteroidota bacterium]
MFTNNNADYILQNNKELYRLIDKLEDENQHIFWGDNSTNLARNNIWADIKRLLDEQKELFKKRSYFPTVTDRNNAWDEFRELQDRAYKLRRTQKEEYSDQIFDQICEICRNAEDVSFFGFYKFEPKDFEELKEKSSLVKEAWSIYKEKKFNLTKDNREELYERLTNLSNELNKNWEDYNKYREQKKEDRRDKLTEILSKKNYQLSNSRNFLDKLYDNKSDIENNISSAYSDSYREKQEDKLDHLEDKIKEVERQIEDLEDSIIELQNKIDNIN